MYIVVNGREYPELIELVENKIDWIGGLLYDSGSLIDQRPPHERNIILSEVSTTYITDIIFAGTSNDSNGLPGTACFTVRGERFSKEFDVTHGGFTGLKDDENGFIEFIGPGSHLWAIKKRGNTNLYSPWDEQ